MIKKINLDLNFSQSSSILVNSVSPSSTSIFTIVNSTISSIYYTVPSGKIARVDVSYYDRKGTLRISSAAASQFQSGGLIYLNRDFSLLIPAYAPAANRMMSLFPHPSATGGNFDWLHFSKMSGYSISYGSIESFAGYFNSFSLFFDDYLGQFSSIQDTGYSRQRHLYATPSFTRSEFAGGSSASTHSFSGVSANTPAFYFLEAGDTFGVRMAINASVQMDQTSFSRLFSFNIFLQMIADITIHVYEEDA
jgi:hypothetical protein